MSVYVHITPSPESDGHFGLDWFINHSILNVKISKHPKVTCVDKAHGIMWLSHFLRYNKNGDDMVHWIKLSPSCPGARFTNDFLPAIQIRCKLRLAVIPLLAIRSQQIFVYAATAQLSYHVQNFVAITVSESRWEWEWEWWRPASWSTLCNSFESTGVQSSNKMQWLDIAIGYLDSCHNNGRHGDMTCHSQTNTITGISLAVCSPNHYQWILKYPLQFAALTITGISLAVCSPNHYWNIPYSLQP